MWLRRHADDFRQNRFLVWKLAGRKLRINELSIHGDFETTAVGWLEFERGDLFLEC